MMGDLKKQARLRQAGELREQPEESATYRQQGCAS